MLGLWPALCHKEILASGLNGDIGARLVLFLISYVVLAPSVHGGLIGEGQMLEQSRGRSEG